MKRLVQILVLMGSVLILQSSLYAASNFMGMTESLTTSSMNTRTSYAEGCYVGNCTSGYGYYFDGLGGLVIGKWSPCGDHACIVELGVQDNINFFGAASVVDSTASFGMKTYHSNSLKNIGNYGRNSSDSRVYLNGMALRISTGVSEYGSFDYGEFIADGCKIYYANALRTASKMFTVEGKANRLLRTTTCNEGNCVNGIGKMTYSNGFYIGDFRDGFIDGNGIFIGNNGDKYAGKWLKGVLDQGYYYRAADGAEIAYLNVSSSRWYRYTKGGELSVFENNVYLGDYCTNPPKEGLSPAIISYILE